MPDKHIIFVCEHGAAKSIIAAAFFNKLAAEKNRSLRAIARATNPDAELSSPTIIGLQNDGLQPTESKPQLLTTDDLTAAQRIVTFCELPAEFQNQLPVESWSNVPPVSENYAIARDAILQHIEQLLK